MISLTEHVDIRRISARVFIALYCAAAIGALYGFFQLCAKIAQLTSCISEPEACERMRMARVELDND